MDGRWEEVGGRRRRGGVSLPRQITPSLALCCRGNSPCCEDPRLSPSGFSSVIRFSRIGFQVLRHCPVAAVGLCRWVSMVLSNSQFIYPVGRFLRICTVLQSNLEQHVPSGWILDKKDDGL